MSKVMLVFDEPKGCRECMFIDSEIYEDEVQYWCGVEKKDIIFDIARPDWCPLRYVPECVDSVIGEKYV